MSTRILVVDDELDTLNLLRTILEISGYAPITTLNSVDALDLAEVENPDVVLLDIMMPKLDGFALCKLMRQKETTQDLPIIFVTAYEALDLEERRVEAGADMVIHKPINMDALIKAVEEVPALRAAQAAANRQAASAKSSNGTTPTTIQPPVSVTPPVTPDQPLTQPKPDQKK
ncbi:MAG: response regulator [Anaerolineae bacterium]|nr:response regulator [Anaerolineae bacterium]